MKFSYENWKKENEKRRKPTVSAPNYDEFRRNRESRIEQGATSTSSNPISGSFAAWKQEEELKGIASNLDAQGPRSEAAREADAQRFAKGHVSPKSEKARQADADRVTGSGIAQAEKQKAKTQQAVTNRYEGYATSARHKERLEDERFIKPDEPTVPKPADLLKPVKKGDKHSLLSSILGGEDNPWERYDVRVSPVEPVLDNAPAREANKGFVEGFFDKKNDRDTLAEMSGAATRLGFSQAVEGLAGGARWMGGNDEAGENAWHKIGKGFQAGADWIGDGFEDAGYEKEFGKAALTDPEYYAKAIPQAAPQILTSLIPGLGAAGATNAALRLTKLPNLMRKIVSYIGGGGVVTAIDSSIEAGQVYDEALRRGMTPEEAKSAGNESFLKNVLLTIGSNTAEMALLKLPIIKGIKKLSTPTQIGARTAGGALLEGTQEGLQDWISASVLDDDFSLLDPSTLEAVFIGAILGGGVTNVAATYQATKSAFSNNPNMDAELGKIVTRTVDQLPAETRKEYDSVVNDLVADGFSQEEARELAMDRLLEIDPTIETLLEIATKEVMDDIKLEQQSRDSSPVSATQNENIPTVRPIESQMAGNTPSFAPGSFLNTFNELGVPFTPRPIETSTQAPQVPKRPRGKSKRQQKKWEKQNDVNVGDTVNLEGTRPNSEYKVENVEGDTVTVVTPNKKTIKVSKSKIQAVINREEAADREAAARTMSVNGSTLKHPSEFTTSELSNAINTPFAKQKFTNDQKTFKRYLRFLENEYNGRSDKTDAKTPVEVGDTVNLEGTRPETEYKVEAVDEDAVTVTTPNKRTIKVPKSKIKQIKRAFERDGENAPLFDDAVKSEIDTTIPPNFRNDVKAGIQEYMDEEDLSFEDAIAAFKDEYNDMPHLHPIIDEEAEKVKARTQQAEPEQTNFKVGDTLNYYGEEVKVLALDGNRITIGTSLVNSKTIMDISDLQKALKETETPAIHLPGVKKGDFVRDKRDGYPKNPMEVIDILEDNFLLVKTGKDVPPQMKYPRHLLEFVPKESQKDDTTKEPKAEAATATKTDSEWLVEIATSWIQMTGQRKFVDDRYLSGDKAGAKKKYIQQLKISGSSGRGRLSYGAYTGKPEIRLPDGSDFRQTTFDELFKAYASTIEAPTTETPATPKEPKAVDNKPDSRTEWLQSLKTNDLVWNTKTNTQGIAREEWNEHDNELKVWSETGMVKKVEWWKYDDIEPYRNQLEESKNVEAEQPKAETKPTPKPKPKPKPNEQKQNDDSITVHRIDEEPFVVKIGDEILKFVDDSTMKKETVTSISDNDGLINGVPKNMFYPLDYKTGNQNFLDDHIEVIHVGDAPKPAATVKQPIDPAVKMKDNLAWLKQMEEEARERIKKRQGRALSGLPMDDLVDYAIIGASKIAHKSLDYVAFSQEMIKEFGENLEGFMAAIFAQSNQMLNRTFGQADEAIKLVSQEESNPEESEGAKKVESNEVRTDSEEPLEGTPTEDVQRTDSDGQTEEAAVSGAREDEGRDTPSDPRGDDDTPSGGDIPTDVDTSTDGGRPTKPINAEPGNYRIKPKDIEGVVSKDAVKHNLEAIRIVKQLEAEGRKATAKEQKKLIKYVGWGGIKGPFEPMHYVKPEWKETATQLREMLTKEEFSEVAATILNAHYTAPAIINGMYKGLQSIGFEGGRILEPGMGTGHFIGLLPETMLNNTRFTGIELDSITAKIAKYLYPQSDTRIAGFEDTKLANDFYDIAIGNVPFGNYQVVDSNYQKFGVTKQIHNYFFAKSLDKVRPGGLVAFITHSGTLDAKTNATRAYLANKAELVTAIRLPNTAFKDNAGTEVITDIIVLRKLKDGEVSPDKSWMELGEFTAEDGKTVSTNKFFADNPKNVLGDTSVKKDQYYNDVLFVKGTENQKLQKEIEKIFKKLPKDVYEKSSQTPVTTEELIRETFPAPDHAKEGAFVMKDGKPYINMDGKLVPTDIKGKTLDRLKGILGVRDAMRKLFIAQVDNKDVANARKELNKVYDKFVKENGPLNRPVNARIFLDDPDFYLLMSIEKYTAEKAKGSGKKKVISVAERAEKGDIFTKNTSQKYEPPTSADTPEDALRIAMNETGSVNVKRIAALLGVTEEAAISQLRDLVFNDPDKGYVTKEEYLSGNVRIKLEKAKNAVEMDSDFQRNVDALELIIPEDIPQQDIEMQMGVGWIGEAYTSQFIKHLTGKNSLSVRYNKERAEWVVVDVDKELNGLTSFTSKWGNRRRKNTDILSDALNGKNPKIHNKYPDGTKVLDKKETAAARNSINRIRDEFKRWIWDDDARRNDLVRTYNDKFNSIVLRKYDGSHLTFPGMNPYYAERLYKHQRSAIYRATQDGNALFAHAVGAGKTFEMIASMMEMKRMGIVSKPMWTVPNHLVSQMASDFMILYPKANILVPSRADKTAKGRKKYLAKIATGTYDAVILPHSLFSKISMSAKEVEQFFQEQIDQLEAAIIAEAEAGKRSASRLATSLEKAKKSLKAKMKKQLEKIEKDGNTASFEELGVDSIVVDEAHEFKNLFFGTRRGYVGGLGNSEGSGKAFDLFMKTRYLQRINGGKGIIFATGTPISNSLTEMYTMMRYLSYDTLVDSDLNNFDAWANNFAEIKNQMEIAPEGNKYRMREKVAGFINLPEMLHQFRTFADVWTADALLKEGLIKRPKIKDGKRETVIIPPSSYLTEYMAEIAERSEAVRAGQVPPEEDNMLKITNDGRFAALDMRLIDPTLPDDPSYKVNYVVNDVMKVWEATKERQGTQLVFLDLSTPSKEVQTENDEEGMAFSVYNDLRVKLIRSGIPANEIAFIHDANTDVKKEELFANVNEGNVRVLIGSTAKMGAGTNVQTKLAALHHVDVPWRPSDLEQREGRILRPGNEFEEVQIFNYATETSFDAYMWQLIESKAKVIAQALQGDLKLRKLADDGDQVMNAAVIKALSTGDVRVIDYENLKIEIDALEDAKASFEDDQREVRGTIKSLPDQIKRGKRNIELFKKDTALVKDMSGDKFVFTANGITTSVRKDAGNLLYAAIDKVKKKKPEGADIPATTVGKFSGFDVVYGSNIGLVGLGREYLYLQGPSKEEHGINFGETPDGTIQSMENRLKNIPKHEERAIEMVGVWESELTKLNELVGRPFPKDAELTEKRAERDRLAVELNMDENPEEIILDDGIDSDEDTYVEVKGPSKTDDDNDNDDGAIQQETKSTPESSPQPQPTKRSPEDFKTRAEITKFIMKNFKVAIGVGQFKQRARGIYKNKFAIIRVKQYGDFEVIAHELGHSIDKRLGISAQPRFKEELINFAEANLELPASMTNKERAKEGVAEFFRQMLYKGIDMEANASYLDASPELKAFIRDGLSRLKWTTHVEKLERMIHAWITRDGEQEIRGITSPMGARRKPKKTVDVVLRAIYTGIFDEDHPIYHAMRQIEKETGRSIEGKENAYSLAVLTRGTVGRAMTFVQGYTFDADGDKTGESFENILKDVDDIQEFGEYLVARRALYLKEERGKTDTPITPELAKPYLAQRDEKYAALADRVYDYQDSLLQVLVDGGLIAADLPKKLRENDKYYVPFYRVLSESGLREDEKGKSGRVGSGYANTDQGIKRMSESGSALNVINPIESIIKNTHLYHSLADRNSVGMALAALADPKSIHAAEATKDIIEKISNKTQVLDVALAQLEDTLLAAGIEQGILDDIDMNKMGKIFNPIFKPSSAKNEILVWNNGKPSLYKVRDDMLYNSLVASDNRILNNIIMALKPLEWAKDAQRTGITANPIFTLRTFARSAYQLVVKTEATGWDYWKQPGRVIKAIGSVAGKTDPFWQWMSSGGGQSTLISVESKYLEQKTERIALKAMTKNKLRMKQMPAAERKELRRRLLKSSFSMPFAKLNAFNDTLDQALKLAEFQVVMKQSSGDRVKAALASREADLDYKRKGSVGMDFINRYVLFWNVSIQGPDNLARYAIKHPLRFALRGFVGITFPTIVRYLLNRDDEEYQELESFERDNYWSIPKGDGTFWKIPIPFEAGILFKTIPEHLIGEYMDYARDENKQTWEGFGRNVSQTLLASFLPVFFEIREEWKSERQIGTKRDIVPSHLQSLKAAGLQELQYTDNTSEAAKLAGKLLKQSPVKLDHAYESLFAQMGQAYLWGVDQLLVGAGVGEKKDSGLVRNYFHKQATTSVNDGTTSSVTNFYKHLAKLEGEHDAFGTPYNPSKELKAYRKAAADMKELRGIREAMLYDQVRMPNGEKFSKAEKKRQVTIANNGLRDIARLVQGKEPLDREGFAEAQRMIGNFQKYEKAKKKAEQKKVQN